MKNLFLIFKNFMLFFYLICSFIKKNFKFLMFYRLLNNFSYYLLGKKVIGNYLIILNFSLLIVWEDFIKLILDFYFIVEKIIILFFFCFYIIISYVFFNFFKIFLYCNFYAVSLIVPLLICVAYLTLVERKVIGASQRRLGPEFVGLFGLGQPIADV